MTPANISVLYVDDEPALLDIGRIFLEESGDLSVTTLTSAERALASPAIASCDAIVSDYQMTGMNGITFLKEVRKRFGDIPFIIFTGRSREEIVIEAINNGADFYLQKGGDPDAQFAELAHKIAQAVTRRRTQAELKEANRMLSESRETLQEKFDELRRREEELRESEARYRAVFENTGTATIIIEEDGTISLANSRYAGLAGLSLEEIEGKKNWRDFFITEDLPMMDTQHVLRRADPQKARPTYDCRFRSVSGEIRDILIFVDIIPGTKMSVASLLDITSRKRADKELDESRERFAQVAESAEEWIWETDARGLYTYSSPVVEKILGYTPQELVGKKYFYDLFVPEEKEALIHQALDVFNERKSFKNFVNATRHRDGRTVMLETSGAPIIGDDGSFVGYRGADLDVTGRIAADNELKESRERYRLMLMNAKDGILVNELTPKGPGKFIEVNDTACRILGMTKGELAGISLADLDMAETKGRARELVGKILKDRHVTFQIPYRTKSGEEKFLDISVSIFDFRGRPTMFSIVRDITGQKVTETALKTMVTSMVGKTGLEALTKITENVMAWLDADCVIVGEILPGTKTVQVRAMIRDNEQVTDYSYPLAGTPCENATASGFCFYPDHACELFPNDKDLVAMHIRGYAGTPLRNHQGDVIGILCALSKKPFPTIPALREIMEIIAVKAAAEIDRSRIESALRESEQKFRDLVEASPDIIWEMDQEGKFRYVSPTIETVTGYLQNELIGKTASALVAEEAQAHANRELRQSLASDGPIPLIEIHSRDRDGQPLMIEIRASRVRDRDGNLTGFRGVARDITQRKKAEDALMRANRQLTLLGTITRHDALNKITVILGYLRVAQKRQPGPDADEFIKKAETVIAALRSQMEFTRVYQNLASREPQWTDLDEVLKNLQVPDTLSLETKTGGIRIYADPMVGKIFSNLLDNSLRHGEHVTKIRVTSRREGTALVISWEDNGVGIAAEEKEQIFTRGIGKHTGLGLFLVREILALTGISIQETGEPGRGARFEIIIPEGAYRTMDL